MASEEVPQSKRMRHVTALARPARRAARVTQPAASTACPPADSGASDSTTDECAATKNPGIATEAVKESIPEPMGGLGAGMARADWLSLGAGARSLRPEIALANGQSFSWAAHGDTWRAVIDGVLVAVRQLPDDTHVRALSPCTFDLAARMRDYFQLGADLESLYAEWSRGHKRMEAIGRAIPGMRVLRQDPVECLFSFICSSNNNIPRIQSLVDKLRQHYGVLVADGHHAFPTLEALQRADEGRLRELGFGYRAAFIVKAAQQLADLGGAQWLSGLRLADRETTQTALMQLHGVGQKVADCVALFCLDKHDVVPVDTHVLQIARRDFPRECGPCTKMNKQVYSTIGDTFRSRFGTHAGWAHSLMFTAELKVHAWRLVPQTPGSS
eukprot:m.76585 g.76585  ORF g.76585 m.76585 type:complete len:385 (-) comp7880_c0_seq3:233-1387(-)